MFSFGWPPFLTWLDVLQYLQYGRAPGYSYLQSLDPFGCRFDITRALLKLEPAIMARLLRCRYRNIRCLSGWRWLGDHTIENSGVCPAGYATAFE